MIKKLGICALCIFTCKMNAMLIGEFDKILGYPQIAAIYLKNISNSDPVKIAILNKVEPAGTGRVEKAAYTRVFANPNYGLMKTAYDRLPSAASAAGAAPAAGLGTTDTELARIIAQGDSPEITLQALSHIFTAGSGKPVLKKAVTNQQAKDQVHAAIERGIHE